MSGALRSDPVDVRGPVAPAPGAPDADGWEPAYLALHRSGQLPERAQLALGSLAKCRVCARDCDVDRLADTYAFCRTGRHAVVSSAFRHVGEEDCLRGSYGSGTIFFGHCNLRCVFCQNYDISQALKVSETRGVPAPDIAALMLALQAEGCHNINFVTPEHVAPQVLEAVAFAAARGLRLPIVYNTSAYDSAESLAQLDGVVDIYMPDFKYWKPESGSRYVKAANYADVARARIAAMHRQVGSLRLDENRLAYRGLLVRHLVMPGALDETEAILTWIRDTLGRETYVNLMDQYRPAGRVTETSYAELNRPLDAGEYAEARQIAVSLGLTRLDARRPHP